MVCGVAHIKIPWFKALPWENRSLGDSFIGSDVSNMRYI